MNNMHAVSMVALALFIPTTVPAQAPPAPPPIITVTCPATGPGVGVCAGLAILMHELVQAANGDGEAFGPNGEVMKLLKAPIEIVEGNVNASSRESGDLSKAIRVTTGISLKDIEEKGLLGGDNSEARKICNAIAAVGGGKC